MDFTHLFIASSISSSSMINGGLKYNTLPRGRTDTPTAKAVGFLCTFTSKYTRKYIRLMSFHKTFITKDTFVSINDNTRLVSKPVYNFKSQYYLNFYYLLIFLFPYYVVYRNYQIFHYIY